MLGKNSLPHLSQFLEASCTPWLVASSSSKTDTADPDLLVVAPPWLCFLHPFSSSDSLGLPGLLQRPATGRDQRCHLVLLCWIRFQSHHYLGGKGGLGWHSMPGTVPGVAVLGGHSRTGLGPPHWFTFFVCCTVDIPPGFSWSPRQRTAPRGPV